MRFLELLHEYTYLRAKRERLDIPLDHAEEARLHGLERLLRGDTAPLEGRRLPRLACPLPVQLTMPGSFASGRLRNISGEGACVRTAASVRPGDRVLLHVHDTGAAVEYVLPSRIVWRRGGERPAVGVAFDGIPMRSRLPEHAAPSARGITPLVA